MSWEDVIGSKRFILLLLAIGKTPAEGEVSGEGS